ncbi:hypothetical protein GLW08_12170 [Pontibacillus yanchengensis]|uniref:Uncharacterized protein n=2 Tax=Pontibacillus yanchengensis TaxID=462910 RepID=A0ACC7VIS7_9BACI|nr:hypothetical protein [Pontibacillus yanchengensis]MYL34044.1 hypothetical protein [Pontibacillus yanchengensis]MYL54094.1 hypothetical protein [Pontibacillus yanchengensis]
MSSGMLLWTLFLFMIFFIGIIKYFCYPIPILQYYSEHPPTQSTSLRKMYFILQLKGYIPFTQVKVGKVLIDIALLDVKVAIMYYRPQDLLYPAKKRRMEKQKQFLQRNGWTVWHVREKDLTQQFHQTLQKISSQKK